MGTDRPVYTPVEYKLNPLKSQGPELMDDLDPEKTSKITTAKCQPAERFNEAVFALEKDPFRTIGEIGLVGGGEELVTNPITGIIVRAGKLTFETGNVAIAWALHSKTRKKLVISTLVVGMVLSATGCGSIITSPVEKFNTSTPIIQNLTPNPSEPGENSTATTLNQMETPPTSMPEPTEIPYPVSTEGFLLDTRGFRLSDRNAISEIGKSQDMRRVEDIYRAEIVRNGEAIGDFHTNAIFWEGEGKPYWEDVVQDSSYHFLGMKITDGEHSGKVTLGLSNYLADYKPEDDFFDFFPIENPSEYPKADQEVFWDKSGNPIVGIINAQGNLTAWYNMSKGEQGGWEITSLPAGETEAQDIWQLSPDGHIYYNEKELYDGLFTINKEHPEWVEKYWEDTIRGLWNLNNVSDNQAFINQFPTDDKLVDYLKNGGGPVSNLWIPVIYPNSKRQFLRQATMIPASGKIDLSKIAIAIYKPTTEEIYKYSPSYASGTKYISYSGAAGEVLIEEINMGNTTILKITHRRDLLVDALRMPFVKLGESGSAKEFYMLSISPDKKNEENLLAATQLLKYWNRQALMRSVDGWAEAYWTYYNPPVLGVNTIKPTYQECVDITTIEGSPIALR